ncbi:Hpt domain-containing protein [Breoghania sp. L-A4]|uniref:Hpt domain-containing protein n=1 Tax=Breoghania sp. L-A4 TaxID=2304600 RepID=UPI000E35CE2A|nr:Hpt domain-containing protein [Breoghania sp. L-A4]AXS39853.1 hypothetical protein D1F64_07060 [Breoghania sp. L-A4]
MTGSQTSTALEDPLRKLALAFRQQAIADARTLRALGATAHHEQNDEARGAALSAIQTLAHRLAGRGGTFGFPEISTIASELEVSIDAVLPRHSGLPAGASTVARASALPKTAPGVSERIQALVEHLCATIETLKV